MKKPCLILSLVFSLATLVQAANFYVAPTGNDAFPGTQAQPWKTIQHAADNATPGSTVYILAGTYFEEVYLNVSGTAGNYITFTHFASDVVVIDGGSTNTQKVLLTIAGQRYIRIQGLRFANAMGNFSIGIEVTDGADHIELLDNEIYNIHFSTNPNAAVTSNTNVNPLILYGTHPVTPVSSVLISGNTIHDCRTGYSEALTATGNVDGFTITNNSVHDITNIGIDLAGGYGVCATAALDAARNGVVSGNAVYNCVSNYAVAAGIYVDGSRDVVIERNTVHDCGRGYEVGCEQAGKTATNVIVRNNVAWHNREAAIGIGGYDYPSTGKVTFSKILNNTCYDNAWTNNGDGELLVEYTENCTVANNLFYATNPAKYLLVTRLPSTGLALDYNLYYHAAGSGAVKVDWKGTIYTGFPTYKTATNQDAHALFGNPLLAGAQNFHLTAGSPAYNTGDPAFVPAGGETDLDGDNRVLLGRVDIGADESATVLPVQYVAPLSGSARPPGGNQLYWTTGAELATDHFDVERGTDHDVFEKIGEVAAKGQSTMPVNYTYLDKSPAQGNNYYRLRQVDADQRATYSNSILLAYEDWSVSVFPNPVSDRLEIRTSTDWERAALYDAAGQPIRTFLPGNSLPLADLPSGPYWLEIYAVDGGGPSGRWIVKR